MTYLSFQRCCSEQLRFYRSGSILKHRVCDIPGLCLYSIVNYLFDTCTSSVTYGFLETLQIFMRRSLFLGRDVALHCRQSRQDWPVAVLTSWLRCHPVSPKQKGDLRGVEGSGDVALIVE